MTGQPPKGYYKEVFDTTHGNKVLMVDAGFFDMNILFFHST